MITAFDVATAEVRWSLDLAARDTRPFSHPEVSTPAYANGVLYLARGPADMSTPHEVVAIDVAVQEVRWRSASPTSGRMFVGAVTEDAVITVARTA